MSGLLTGGDRPDPVLALNTTPPPPAPPPGDRITVYATVAVRTSAGPGPGVLELPAAEANRLIGMRYAVYGDRPPRNFLDGGQPGPVTPVREFR